MCCRARTASSTLLASSIPRQAQTQNRRRRRHLGTLPQSVGFDLLHGTEHKQRDEVELYPTHLSTSIEFGKLSHPECAVFSPDGHSLITGSVDGFLEVWDASTGKIRKDLAFQAAEEFMVHDQAVLCVATSRDGVAIVSGTPFAFWRLPAVGLVPLTSLCRAGVPCAVARGSKLAACHSARLHMFPFLGATSGTQSHQLRRVVPAAYQEPCVVTGCGTIIVLSSFVRVLPLLLLLFHCLAITAVVSSAGTPRTLL
jgi:hypothetical protein